MIKIRDRVRVEGRDEIFRALVDSESGTVDLACIERIGCLIRVPFERLRPANDDEE